MCWLFENREGIQTKEGFETVKQLRAQDSEGIIECQTEVQDVCSVDVDNVHYDCFIWQELFEPSQDFSLTTDRNLP